MNRWLIQSKEQKKKIMIFYMDRNNNVTQRIIRVVEIKDESIVAFCYYRKKVRTFRKSHILSAGSVRKRVGA
ncbi:hypothetical protein GMD78_06255 [Ornithinibacillus sp. L9]|uniref:WYL domain-containing protein n=1 Tax=Ornithinibacillus caprae TaxID=2678566 RepID=A0A6N8FEM9_9BACI|nr:hypothetical protein [Ornithinibacillus caprae]MUK88000.1 hypothetical protein [Ornithinibacillus caprae]